MNKRNELEAINDSNTRNRVEEVVNRLFSEKILKYEEERNIAINMAWASYRALNRSRNPKKPQKAQWDNGLPKGKFEYHSALYEMMCDCMAYKEGMNFAIWRKLYERYEKTGYQSHMNVTWDRINDDSTRNASIDYILPNMQPLHEIENKAKSKNKPMVFFLFRENLSTVIGDVFESITEIKEAVKVTGEKKSSLLVDAAMKVSDDRDWELVEFEFNNKKYLAQIHKIDKLKRYYSSGNTILPVPDLGFKEK